MGRYRLAVTMIVRNEAQHLGRALDSVRSHVDEIRVLDTGSTDGTPDIARAHGAEVAHFHWVDDFAAARNAALALTQADWRLVLDADEWLADGAATLHGLRDLAPDFVGQVRVDSLFNDARAGTGTAPSWLPRLLPRGVPYQGRIHEQPRHALPVRRLPVALGHDGYLPEALRHKAGRNQALLTAALCERPDDAYLHYQLGKDHDVYGRHAEAAACFARSRACDGPPASPALAWWHDRLVRELHALTRCQAHAQGVQLAEQAMDGWGDSPDFWFALGNLLLDWAAEEPARAGELVPMIEAAWQRCLAIGERPDLEGAVAGRGSHLAAGNLALLYDTLGRPADAVAARRLTGRPG